MSAQIDIAAQDTQEEVVAGGLAALASVDHIVSSSTVDGIPVLFAARASEQDGQRTAGLFFRGGRARRRAPPRPGWRGGGGARPSRPPPPGSPISWSTWRCTAASSRRGTTTA